MASNAAAKVKTLFAGALSQPVENRAAYLLEHCEGDADVQRRVEELLEAHYLAGDFFDRASGPLLSAHDSVCGRYAVGALLGRGGMGEVYEAFDQHLSVTVALKVFRGSTPEETERFRREILLARQVPGPYVCRVFDYHRDTALNLELISMERLQGRTLAAHLLEGPFDEKEAVRVLRQICAGLEAAHSRGIVHRDLKPGNVMLVPDGADTRAVIMDFGLARGLEFAPDSAPQFKTESGRVYATPIYAAPEQLKGEAPTTATDIYAVGLILYEMLAGKRPFASAGGAEALRRLTDDPPPLKSMQPGVPVSLEAAVTTCLRRDPKARFQSCGELLEALEAKRSHRKRIAAAAALGALLASAALPWLLRRPLPADRHVVVLPFVSNPGTEAAFNAGLAASLSGQLSRAGRTTRRFWVVPYEDVEQAGIRDPAKARKQFGANLALQTKLSKGDGNFEFELSLLDAATGQRLRRSSWRAAGNDLAATSRKLAGNAIAALELPAMKESEEPGRSTNPAAYELYEQANGYMQRFGANEIDQAIGLFEKALAADPAYTPAWAGLARARTAKFRFTHDTRWLDEAEEAARRGLALDPDNADVQLSVGMVDFNRGRYPESIRIFQRALQKQPDLTAALTMQARSYEAMGEVLQADRAYRQAIATMPDYWASYNDLGWLYYRHGEYDKSESLFRTATELAPDNPLVLANLGGALLAQEKYADARRVLERALDLKPTPGVYSNLGTALYWEKNYQESAKVFRKAVELTPKDACLWRNLGDALERNQDAQGGPVRVFGVRQGGAQSIVRRSQERHLRQRGGALRG
jgi:tetratricopeptide (TPR) repeat protein